MPETKKPTEERAKRAKTALRELRRLYPDATCALEHRSALELLVATILSAQSTDANVNKVTPVLFDRWPDAKSIAEAEREDVEEVVRSTGFFRQKAKNVQAACQRLVDDFGGKVPRTIEELVTLPGVARKTANVLLGTWYGQNDGVVVDTHVGRLAHRLDLTWTSKDTKDAVKIEKDLMAVVPQKEWTFFGHAIILHGRQICHARKPACNECTMQKWCPSAETDA